jgi:hypothetical protein
MLLKACAYCKPSPSWAHFWVVAESRASGAAPRLFPGLAWEEGLGMEVSKEMWKAAGLYTLLMDEVKRRHACIRVLLDGKLGFQDVFVREFSILQLRMICETIVASPRLQKAGCFTN